MQDNTFDHTSGSAGGGVLVDEEDQPSTSQLLTCSFNQDGGCLAVGTANGFAVHNLHPYTKSVERQLGGGIGHVEMLFRCNLMALVGGGPSPQAPPHRVLIWDDHIPKEIGELSFRQVVLRVKLRKDAIAVALHDRIYVYQLSDLSLRDKIYTADNPHGLLCLSTQISDMVLACPSVTLGHVRVELYGLRKTVLIEAHTSALRGLALTANGTKLATASTKGTVIRVWDVPTGTCLQEFRRGVERATITCLAWSWDDGWLACTSDKGTAHIFQMSTPDSEQEEKKRNESYSFTKRLFSTVIHTVEGDAKKSVCQVRGVPHPQACAFVADSNNLLAVAGWDADGNGVLLLSEFTPSQEPRRVGYHVVCGSAVRDASEEVRRRRRLRGWTPETPHTPEGGRLYVGERLEILERGMDQIHFEEKDEFVQVTAIRPMEDNNNSNNVQINDVKVSATKQEGSGADHNGGRNGDDAVVGANSEVESSQHTDEGRSNLDLSTVGDSVRTEPLDDEGGSNGSSDHHHQ